MTDDPHDLRRRSHLGPIIGTAIAVGGAVWGSTTWLMNRADKEDIRTLTNSSFKTQLDMEVFRGEFKAINMRLDTQDQYRSLSNKMDKAIEVSRRRRRNTGDE